MLKETSDLCTGRAEDLLLRVDGQLDPATQDQLEQHLLGCPACQQLAADLRAVDAALAACCTAPVLTDAFDQSVVARLDALSQRDRASLTEMQAWAERDRVEALEQLRATARRGLGAGLLNLAGLAALLWAGGQLAPRLLDFVDQYVSALPVVSHVGTAVTVAALAIAAAYLVSKVQNPTVAD